MPAPLDEARGLMTKAKEVEVKETSSSGPGPHDKVVVMVDPDNPGSAHYVRLRGEQVLPLDEEVDEETADFYNFYYGQGRSW